MKAIGIDIGGTKIAAGLVDVRVGTVLKSLRIATEPKRGGNAILNSVIDLVKELRTDDTQAIGVGLPELVSPTGELMSNATIGWQTIDAREQLASILPTTFDADVRCAARAEARFGAGIGIDTFIYVTIGTGISCCLMINGKPFLGARGLTGTFASASSLVPTESGALAKGVPLEEFASGPGIARRHESGDAKIVLERAAAGWTDATEIAANAGLAIGAAIAALVNTLDPQLVVVGGGLGLAEGNFFRKALLHGLRTHVWSELHADVPIVPAKLGSDAGIIGAALVAVS